ncbi:MAG: DUF89 family protein [Bacteroidetes bacterium]|nr:DUF89 family protein [Bacteroidota bacterium]
MTAQTCEWVNSLSTTIDTISYPGISSTCHTCLINQAYSTADFSKTSPEQTENVIQVVRAELERSKTVPLLPQHIARAVEDAVNSELGKPHDYDLYAELKELSNRISLSYLEKFQEKIDKSANPLETGMQIAAAGNIIDFGAKNHNSINLDEELQSFDAVSFAHYDIEPFRDGLENAASLLYICDNCGEIVFDKLFVQELQKEYPGLHITVAVRGKPILNDATLADALFIGFDSIVPIISSGSIYPGTILPETSRIFKQMFAEADVIISKGQGNFETLLPVADKRLFFLLRIKCSFMSELSGVAEGSLVLMQGNNA